MGGITAICVLGRVDNKELRMLVDTGSAVTLIHKNVYEQLDNTKAKLRKVLVPVVSANGEPLTIEGQCVARFTLGGLTVSHNVLIAGGISQECLLGADFLVKHKGVIELDKRVLLLGGNRTAIDLEVEESKPVTSKVSLVQTVTIPGRHEMIVPARVDLSRVPIGTPGVIEQTQKFAERSEIRAARVVVQPAQGGVVPVRLVNPSPTPVILYGQSTVGIFHQVEQECHRSVASTSLVSDHSQRERGVAQLFELDKSSLCREERKKVTAVLSEYQDIISGGSGDLGRTSKIYHGIDTGEARPIRQAPRRVPGHRREEVQHHLEEMLSQDIVQPSSSPWASPIVLVRKKDGSTRFCIDYRKLNDVTRKDAYPLPRIDDTLDAMAGAKIFSTLDLASGYWQVELEPSDREKSAFVTSQGLFEFKVMPFGLTGAPATFQRLMDLVLSGLQWQICLVYLDDVIVFARDFNEHLERLRQVFDRLREAGLKLRPGKCHLFQTQVPYLGHVISGDGVATDPAKVDAVSSWPQPTCVSDVRSFLGLTSYYRRFVENFAQIASPLHRLTEKKAPFHWTKECDQSFCELKRRLVSAPILAYPQFDQQFILDTDASDFGIGAVLSQVQEGQERVIAYASRALTKPERRYSVTRREMLALVYFVKHFRHFLYGRQFIARTDHSALKWLQSFKEPEGQIARWLEQLAEYDFKVQHRPGTKHGNADAMSRIPQGTPDVMCNALTRSKQDTAAQRPNESDPWLATWTADELIRLQGEDADLKQVVAWMRDKKPPFVEVRGAMAVKKIWTHWDRLRLRDGVLYRTWESEDGKETILQLMLPRALVPTVLRTLHNNKLGGHLGVMKTVAKVRERFYWVGWQKDIEEWCRKCEHCAARKITKSQRAPLVSSQSDFPLERIAVDIMGPLPVTTSGNKHIMVISDYFTKWTEAYAIPDQEAKTVAQKIVDEFVCRFGVPTIIHTDQGRNFEAKLFSEMCELLGVDKTRTTPYHPQSDGMVERLNRTLEDMLSHYVQKDQKNWDSILPQVMMAYRSSVHETTRCTPFKLMFGREVRLPIDLMFGQVPDHDTQMSTTDYARHLRDRLESVFEYARVHITSGQRRQKEYYDRKAVKRPYSVGNHVWLYTPVVRKGCTSKFSQPWKGPYKVITKISDVTYRIQPIDGPSRRLQVVHFNRLKPCHALPDPVQPAASKERPVETEKANVADPEKPIDETQQLCLEGADLTLVEGPLTTDPEPAAADGGEQPDLSQNEPVPEPAEVAEETRPQRTVRPPVWSKDYTI